MFRRPAIPGLLSALALILTLAFALSRTAWSQTPSFDLFARSNLVAWCIVPFDAKKRGPEERAEMLTRLGLRRFAYDWRAEHIPTFDAEIAALQKRNIELTAWWFPATLNAEALTILDCLRRHRISPQLWITLGTEPEPDPRKLGEKMAQTLPNLEKLCAAAREVGSTVGLYNHLGWFGEPPNQVALIQRLHAAGHTNVGIVYNFHHGHAHIDRFPELMWLMRPYLLAVNLNGMIRNGEQSGKKITPLGTGTEELDMLRALQRSGWRGPVGILGHTEDDAEWKLGQELEGLSALVPRLNEPGRALARRLASTPDATIADPARPAVASLPPPGPLIVRGRFGPALDARVKQLVTAGSAELRSQPLLVEAWVRLEDAASFNVIAASESKASPTHWELYSYTEAGDLAFFSTAMEPQEVRSGVPICDGRWHHVAVWIDTAEIVLYVDGQEARRTAVQRRARALPRAAQFAIGRLVEGGLGCRGFIESVRLGTTARSGPDFGRGALAADAASLGIWTFETENDIDGWSSLAATVPAQGASQPLVPAAPVAAPEARASASPPSSVPTATATATAIVPTTAATAAKPTLTPPALPPAPSTRPGTIESATKAAPRATGTGVNRDEPWLQTEDNWVDDRWNRTTQGRWQMYTFPSPTGSLRKGLAVRLGSPATASVAYDTETGQWRHAWLGGFLTFDAARFGLLNPPKPAGDSLLALPASARWSGDAFRWRGFAVSGDHLVLEYSVGTLAVRESPGSLAAIDATLLLRDFEFGPHAGFTAELPLLQGDRTQFAEGTVGDTPYAGYSEGSRFRAIALSGDPGVEISTSSRTSLVLRVQPRTTRARARIFYFFGERARVDRLEPALQLERAPANLAERIVSAHGEKTAALPAQGQLGSANEAYAIDTIPVPYDNPWKALLFCSGVGFFTNGDAAVSTIHGDVWRVSGLDASLAKVEWQRIATGLFQPLGLTVVSNQVYVLCRDHLTRLQDLDGDHVTDYYEAFSSLIETSAGGHDYVTSLCRDQAGNFYYVDPKGAHRLSPDGQSRHTLARGFRNPNGMGVSPDGRIVTVAPQQGTWTPSSVIHELRPEGWYGFPGPKVTADRPLGYDLPLCWIPHRVDNSSGGQVWAPAHRFGPLSDQLLHLSWGRCTMLLTLRDVVDGTAQGAVLPLKGRFLSGPMRGEFNPVDGQLYVVGSQGWQTAAARDGSFQRVRWTGKPLVVPTKWEAHPRQLRLQFNEALDPDTATDAGSYSLEAWNYRYAEEYGSKDWSVAQPDREGHDTWEVTAAAWDPATRTVVLTVPALTPVMQFALKFNLDAASGAPAAGELYGTIHRLHSR